LRQHRRQIVWQYVWWQSARRRDRPVARIAITTVAAITVATVEVRTQEPVIWIAAVKAASV
jgi:hypothetical protein